MQNRENRKPRPWKTTWFPSSSYPLSQVCISLFFRIESSELQYVAPFWRKGEKRRVNKLVSKISFTAIENIQTNYSLIHPMQRCKMNHVNILVPTLKGWQYSKSRRLERERNIPMNLGIHLVESNLHINSVSPLHSVWDV